MLVALAPHGSFAALSGGRIVGTAIGIDYGGFSWIAMMLVAPEYRGRGLGRRLLQAALEAVPAHTPVRLDATPLGRPLYQAFGFEDETAITRWVADSSSRVLPALAGSASAFHVRRLSGADFPALAVQDREVFGANRRTVLEWALDAAPGYAHAIDGGASAFPAQVLPGPARSPLRSDRAGRRGQRRGGAGTGSRGTARRARPCGGDGSLRRRAQRGRVVAGVWLPRAAPVVPHAPAAENHGGPQGGVPAQGNGAGRSEARRPSSGVRNPGTGFRLSREEPDDAARLHSQ